MFDQMDVKKYNTMERKLLEEQMVDHFEFDRVANESENMILIMIHTIVPVYCVYSMMH